jgi:hypothetical protein
VCGVRRRGRCGAHAHAACVAMPRSLRASLGNGHAHAAAAAWGAWGIGKKTAGRYVDILFIFRPAPPPPPRYCEPAPHNPRSARVRFVYAATVNKNNVSG